MQTALAYAYQIPSEILYHKLIIGMLLNAKCLIILLNDYNEVRTVLQDIFLLDMPTLLISLI